MNHPHLYALFVAGLIALGGCTFEPQSDGDHGVTLEDTTLVPGDTAVAIEMPAVLDSVTSP